MQLVVGREVHAGQVVGTGLGELLGGLGRDAPPTRTELIGVVLK
jgi:hypothetical protein